MVDQDGRNTSDSPKFKIEGSGTMEPNLGAGAESFDMKFDIVAGSGTHRYTGIRGNGVIESRVERHEEEYVANDGYILERGDISIGECFFENIAGLYL